MQPPNSNIKSVNKYFVIFFIGMLSLGFVACNAPAKKELSADSFLTATNGIELDNRLLAADSLVFVFYKDPYGDDSLRYTRFYTQLSTTDTTDISLLLQNLKQPFTKFENVKMCRSEGKIWCYAKGKVFQTIPFSTRCNDCCFIYLIKDGYFFYIKLDTALSERLSILKPLSKSIEPL